MANLRKQKKEKKKREADMNFFAIKATFVAGIVLIITILKDMIEIFFQVSARMVVGYLIICLTMFFLILGTKLFDEKMKSKKVVNFGNFLTVMSVIIFVIENSVIKYKDLYSDMETLITVLVIGIAIIVGALYLLFAKY